MNEVVHFDFVAQRRLTNGEIAARRLAQKAVTPMVQPNETMVKPHLVEDRDLLTEAAVKAIMEVQVISELPVHAYTSGGPDEVSPYQTLEEALSVLTIEEKDWAWDEAFSRLEAERVE